MFYFAVADLFGKGGAFDIYVDDPTCAFASPPPSPPPPPPLDLCVQRCSGLALLGSCRCAYHSVTACAGLLHLMPLWHNLLLPPPPPCRSSVATDLGSDICASASGDTTGAPTLAQVPCIGSTTPSPQVVSQADSAAQHLVRGALPTDAPAQSEPCDERGGGVPARECQARDVLLLPLRCSNGPLPRMASGW